MVRHCEDQSMSAAVIKNSLLLKPSNKKSSSSSSSSSSLSSSSSSSSNESSSFTLRHRSTTENYGDIDAGVKIHFLQTDPQTPSIKLEASTITPSTQTPTCCSNYSLTSHQPRCRARSTYDDNTTYKEPRLSTPGENTISVKTASASSLRFSIDSILARTPSK